MTHPDAGTPPDVPNPVEFRGVGRTFGARKQVAAGCDHEVVTHPLFPSGGDPDVVCVAGDWHGNTRWAERMLELLAGRSQVILHAGDWGLWSESPSMRKYVSRQDRLLTANDSYLIVTPGNHENWDRLAALPVDPNTGLQKLTDRIWFAPRGYRWRWGDSVWLSLGGAVSVDRKWRRAGSDWWPAEQITVADVEAAAAAGPADVMVCHDAPAGAAVPGLSLHEWPADAIADSHVNRGLIRRVVEACQPRWLWHGHMHARYADRLEIGRRADRPDWDGFLEVRGLDCDGGDWRDNLALVGPDGAPLPWLGPTEDDRRGRDVL